MANHDDLIVRYSTGNERNLGRATNVSQPWPIAVERFRNPLRTAETMAAYDAMSQDEKLELKRQPGWLMGSGVTDGIRSKSTLKPRNLMTLDIDYLQDDTLIKFQIGGLPIEQYEFIAHETRSSRPGARRLRMLVPLTHYLDDDKYLAAARVFGSIFEGREPMTEIDLVSFRQAQMMFFPSVSNNQDYLFFHNKGEILDPNQLLDDWKTETGRDWRSLQDLPKTEKEGDLRKAAEKQEDPTEKRGPVGDFCRTYDVPAAIEKFKLPYEPADDFSEKPRYTYTDGTASSGAIVHDDGLFLYSHHGSDPAGGRNVNAFDLVRLHKFHELDVGHDQNQPNQTALPSYKAMIEFIADDEEYTRTARARKYSHAAMFDDDVLDIPEDDAPGLSQEELDLIGTAPTVDPDVERWIGTSEVAPPPRPKPAAVITNGRKRPPVDPDWTDALEVNPKTQEILPTLTNVSKIIQNDRRLRNCFHYNSFSDQLVVTEPVEAKGMAVLPTIKVGDPINGDLYEDKHKAVIRNILEDARPENGGKGWGLRTSQIDLREAVMTAGHQMPINPVREKLESLEWDGLPRAESLFTKYLGCDPTPYYRDTARFWLIAAVARIFEPGCKFDFVPILVGYQGKRKSTFISILSMGWFGELTGDFKDGKKLVEQMKGCWIMETPELSGMTRSMVEDVKAFFSATSASERLAYRENAQVFHRQCVFMGSTNSDQYLRDITGNRRFWPIQVGLGNRTIDTDALKLEVEQIWAEAVVLYRAMRAEQPTDNLPLYLTDEAAATAERLQEQATVSDESDMFFGRVWEWLDTPIVSHEERMGAKFDDASSPTPNVHPMVSVEMAWKEALGQDRTPTDAERRAVGRVFRKLGLVQIGVRNLPSPWGRTKAFKRSHLYKTMKEANEESLI